jgi:hypothetical protein
MTSRFLLMIVLSGHLLTSTIAAETPPRAAAGDRMRDAYFRRQVRLIADEALADVKTLADWERQRPEMHRRFLDMLGLRPLPPRGDLHATITGKVETDAFTVEKLHFQSSPGLYVTGNLYVPKKATFPAPTVLYVCGHGNIVIDRTSHGSKVFYQHHPIWYASHGYVCLVLDTLELGEVPGEHHGMHRLGRWSWQALGYTPAGVECWSAMRAIDYLQTRKEVDPKRIGITGRSGGGATSWWVAAADDRIQCAVPVAGLGDLWAHVVQGDVPRYRDGVISGHCDCMYFVNTYRWDFTQVMALIAPRPLLLGNSDADEIFPVPGYRRPAEKVRRIYELYGAGDRFQLLETKGPHQDTPALRLGEYRWMNHWLQGDRGDVTEPEPKRLLPQQLKVFDRVPDDAINPFLPDRWRRPVVIERPRDAGQVRQWWKEQAPRWIAALQERCFRGWPTSPPPLANLLVADIKHDGLRLRAWDFTSEEEVGLRVWLLTAEKIEMPTLMVLNVLDEPGWQDLATELGPPFQGALQLTVAPKLDEERFARTRRLLTEQKWSFAFITPRGVGPTRWSEASPFDGKPAGQHIRRRFALLGQTLDGQRVWDVRRALAALRTVADLQGVPFWVQGKNEAAGIALYATLFEPDVVRLDLWYLPGSHADGPTFLNVLRVLDMPQAVALALPRKVKIYVRSAEEKARWAWPLELQQALGLDSIQIRLVRD